MPEFEHYRDRVSYPKGVRPGSRIVWFEDRTEQASHDGMVIDRAAHGVDSHSYPEGPVEDSGYWLWVAPDDGGPMVRVRYYSRGRDKGKAYREDGPMWRRSMYGPRIVDERGSEFTPRQWLREELPRRHREALERSRERIREAEERLRAGGAR